MKVSALAPALKVASLISHSKSPATLYRCVEISGRSARACSEIGEITMTLDEDTGLTQPCLVSVKNLKAVFQSLDPSDDVCLTQSAGNVHWETDVADGSISIEEEQEHQFPALMHDHFPWVPSPSFDRALLLAETAVKAATVSTGLYGVEIVPSGQLLRLGSTHSAAVAVVSLAAGDYPVNYKITLRPPVPKLLAHLLQHSDDCCMDVTGDGVFIRSDWFAGRLALAPPLDGDLFAFANQYQVQRYCVDIDMAAIQNFASRASNLSDNQRIALLSMNAGQLLLAFQGESAKGTEYLLADNVDQSTQFDLSCSIKALKPILEKVTSVVLDYVQTDRVLIFRDQSDDLDFQYFIRI